MREIPYQPVPKLFLVVNIFVALAYLAWWFFPGRAGNPVLFVLLLGGEIYHVFVTLIFWQTVWPFDASTSSALRAIAPRNYLPSVDVFIPTAGEPAEIVRGTAQAARDMAYPNFKVTILNDGFAAKKSNWGEIEILAKEIKVNCITRENNHGAKAGNINNALKQTTGEIIVIFDADMVPHKNFLTKIVPYFVDQKVGFVQTPQYYKNHAVNYVATSAWEQQAFFYGPIMRGKEKDNAVFICGTNVAIRRTALEEIGGFVTDNISEDFMTSIKVHQKGYISYYFPEVLAEGLAPEDLNSYIKQQLRWSRGQLDAIFRRNIIFRHGLTLRQKLQYINCSLFYLNGVVVLIDMIMPLIYLFFGLQPVTAATTSFAIYFAPFMFLNIYTLYLASNASLTFKAISFAQSSWHIQLMALGSAIIGQNMSFVVTPKTAQKTSPTRLVFPHLAYITIAAIAIVTAVFREGLNPSIATNIAWTIFNIIMFIPFIKAAYVS